ncbi:hypothetical protein GCM10010969_35140 [Saccharibacillus kuerlensis]|uniref:Uncharacterized protein n=1 Tax=Saccharibacillus kuerlensis TaxID=459527 RepID=A0ABQ2L8U4_9BACL|nr:hypothetical protein GCM10010969_35140 [Saccharibacillus kuerlensis]
MRSFCSLVRSNLLEANLRTFGSFCMLELKGLIEDYVKNGEVQNDSTKVLVRAISTHIFE